ncbi:hypothetical protein [Pseudoalteromonas luteoviolacea]|uniref:Uncharacterized protein n=1 Tax=Pseudoalteromonas luteoviolacea S4054 TaxID=1129367 RepID=A0A0F6A701_9GAMM|nr:hypothetical protein [Pseudoalteromonas luteoviolacea]AOT07664.1 hypothetical protein S4054249_07320 [Pseudoalteromonas luteoviolacea]AOT12580.1 hypothetical protein S40542_07320 [Pseudoalteromonas luteoviolacea]AOT17494.1 hypothetical protein S4054_07320 [Pseudoalteromonas luteoviolacea]KKE81199.1 hypothetical protein N479_23240 [Pseudoalteromonas luteoviolacea S4054]KZN66327.1 hypothetical protein N481_24335 [Pseudoalteromonas luteoviolacea S4047-1]
MCARINNAFPPAFDDAAIYLKKGNVFFIGENIRPQYQVGPGVLGMKSFRIWGEKALEFINEDTLIVAPHGKVILDKKMFVEYRKNYVAWFKRLEQLFRDGKTTEQILADKTAREIAIRMNLDNNSKYLAHYVSNIVDGNIDVSMTFSDLQIQDYTGCYTANSKHDIGIEVLESQLIIKQLGSIIIVDKNSKCR